MHEGDEKFTQNFKSENLKAKRLHRDRWRIVFMHLYLGLFNDSVSSSDQIASICMMINE
jgi:hypothetical protein